MVNFFYVYSLTWSVIVFLYILGWSDFNVALSPILVSYFAITIPLSLLLGYVCRDFLSYNRRESYPNRKPTFTIAICIGFILEFVYCRQIPLFSISGGSSVYGEFEGIPILHVALIGFSLFYVGYLFHLYLSFQEKKRVLFEIVAIFIMFLLVFSRNCIFFGVVFCALLKIADYKSVSKKKWTLKNWALLVFGILIGLYCFGVLGNIRSGYSWNDTWNIRAVGFYNNSYPPFLSEQYMWTYTYLTSPLANLNLNILLDITDPNLFNYLTSFFPETIAKRLSSAAEIDSSLRLWYDPLNACTGLVNPFHYGGTIGLYLSYVIENSIFLIFCFFKKNDSGRTLVACASCVLTIANFFFNPFLFTGLAFLLLLTAIVPSSKFRVWPSALTRNIRSRHNVRQGD